MNTELASMWTEAVMTYFVVLPQHFPGGNMENLRITCQDSLSPGPDLNSGPPEYKAGVLLTQLQH